MDLEARNAALLAELSSPHRATSSSSSSQPFIPRTPRHTLSSHRAPITRIAFHPKWSIIASSSEDTTVKIWDWESGELERTVKGHTKGVTDVDFSPNGDIMGKFTLY
jgi:platelet-activating factor acetylhydrolase IB subunit alpha